MSEATFEATTVQNALEQAAEQLGADTDQLEYEVVEEKKDFWGTGDDTVVVKAWMRAPQQDEAAPQLATEPEAQEEVPAPVIAAAEEPEEEAGAATKPAEASSEQPQPAAAGGFWGGDKPHGEGAEAAPADVETVEAEETDSAEPAAEEDAVEAALNAEEPDSAAPGEESAAADEAAAGEVDDQDIVGLMKQIFHDMGFDCTIDVQAQPDGFLAAVDGADKELLLEGNGRCLSALELILNNAFRHKLERGQKIRVDAGDFRSRREEELTDLAYQVAHSAKEAGRTQETQPLNPYERRLVHLALAEDPAVTTRSRGSGFLKNVQVIPNRGSGRGGRGRRG